MSDVESGSMFQRPIELNPDTISQITDKATLTMLVAEQEKGDGIKRSMQNERRLVELRTAQAILEGEDKKVAKVRIYDESIAKIDRELQRYGLDENRKSLKYEFVYKKNVLGSDRPDVTPVEGIWIDFIDASQVPNAGIDSTTQAETIIKAIDKQNQLFGRSPARDEVKWAVFRVKQRLTN